MLGRPPSLIWITMTENQPRDFLSRVAVAGYQIVSKCCLAFYATAVASSATNSGRNAWTMSTKSTIYVLPMVG